MSTKEEVGGGQQWDRLKCVFKVGQGPYESVIGKRVLGSFVLNPLRARRNIIPGVGHEDAIRAE